LSLRCGYVVSLDVVPQLLISDNLHYSKPRRTSRGAFNSTTNYGGSSVTRLLWMRHSSTFKEQVCLELRDFLKSNAHFELELCPWDRPVATLQVSGHPLTMVFHSYDKHLFVANESDIVRLVPIPLGLFS
jgi:hypothetical protein